MTNSDKKRKKIYVGLSGGVDSSVSALLLKKQDYEVVGVFIKVWQPDFIQCTWKEDRLDAMRVCAHLGITFKTLDLEAVYKKSVIEVMLQCYNKGLTPNPDVLCNKEVKFGAFLEWAKKMGADGVATGHYAQIFNNETPTLWESVDKEKDQSYFLWAVENASLLSMQFPVGGMNKKETRRIAVKHALPTARKKDSQGLCFIGSINMKDFLHHYIVGKKGCVVLSETGKKVGTHDGVEFFTLGERHGFHITDTSLHKALYVVGKDIKENILIVSNQPVSLNKKSDELNIKNTNWIGDIPQKNKLYKARVRLRGNLLSVLIAIKDENTAKVCFKDTLPLVSSGQSVVLYEEGSVKGFKGLRCLGGGIIV